MHQRKARRDERARTPIASSSATIFLAVAVLGGTAAAPRAQSDEPEKSTAPRAQPAVREEAAADERKIRIYRTVGPDGAVRYTVGSAPTGSAATGSAPTDGQTAGDDRSPMLAEPPASISAVAAPLARPAEPDSPTEGQIAFLRAQIQKDREVLRVIISRPGFNGDAFSKDPTLREIAERLPRLQAELAALEAERP